jgi:hypothetical protein
MERLEVHINNTYTDDYKLISTAQIWDGNAMVSEWKTDDPRAIVYKGIEAAEPNVFEQVKVKKMLEEVVKLFEPNKITVEGK